MQETILLFLSLSVNKNLSWTDDQQHFRERDVDLAAIDDVEDLQHLQESRTGFNYDDFMWLGHYDDHQLEVCSLWNRDSK
ncbi:unnamed protein product [Arctogadus glacialis]